MLDRFEVWRDAEQTVKEWGPVEYIYPHVKGDRLKKGSRVGVVLDTGRLDIPMKYGHMTLGYKFDPKDRQGWEVVSEESMLSGGSFEKPFQSRRCLVPVDRWFLESGSPLGGKRWNCFHPLRKTAMAFAGVYSTFSNPNGTKINSVAIIGISSGEFYKEYDNRMPAVFLPGPEAIQFLNPKLPMEKAWQLLRSWPTEEMTVEPCKASGEVLGE